jgi:hypothetical protein
MNRMHWDCSVRTFTRIFFALAICIVPRIALQEHTYSQALFARDGCSYYVSPAGSDHNSGTLSAPWQHLQKALDTLAPGQTACLRGGTYYEQAIATRSGTGSSPITIQSYPGETAVIDSGPREFRRPGNSDWQLVNASTGEYRSTRTYHSGPSWAYIDGIPGYMNARVVLVPYKSSAAFHATSDTYLDTATPFYAGPGTFYDEADRRIHIRLAKTAALKFAESRYGNAFSSDLPDPRNYSVLLSQAQATLRINASYLIIRNIVFNQAYWTITIENGHDLTFDGITAWMGYYTIEGSGPGVYRITIKNSRIYGDNPYWIFWSDINAPPYPAVRLGGTSIYMRGGTHDWQIEYDHIRGAGLDLIAPTTDENNIFIHHNRIENCGDDALEAEGSINVGHMEWYENYISNCLTSAEIGQSGKTAKFTGPLYIYRNAIVLLRPMPISRKPGLIAWNGGTQYCCSEYMFKQSGKGYINTNIHIYHNTLVMLASSLDGLNLTPQNPENCKIANNVLVMVNGNVNETYRTGSAEVVDGNLYWKVNTRDSTHLLSSYDTVPEFAAQTGLERHGVGNVPLRGSNPLLARFSLNVIDRSQGFWELAPDSEVLQPSNLFLNPRSPAISAGVDLRAYKLPDTRPARSKPDIGAFPFGTSTAEYAMFRYAPAAAQ